jgi:3-hydroxyanthranilate 3,4-dioxygenase
MEAKLETIPEARSRLTPLNLKKWIEDHRSFLKPPVGNIQVWEDREFLVTVVGGPNSRGDFHVNQGEEFFYQIEGKITLRIFENNRFENIEIGEGDIFLLPPRVPHSPQRPRGTIGLVIERKRLLEELDSFIWFCAKCDHKLYEETFHLTDIVKQLPPVFARFYGSNQNCICKKCGTRAEKN